MKYRAMFLAGAAAGYVLGTRAGRERYEQIKRMSRRVAENPTVQETAGLLRAQAGEFAETARTRVGGKVQGMGDRIQDRMPGIRRSEKEEEETGTAAPRPARPAGEHADIP